MRGPSRRPGGGVLVARTGEILRHQARFPELKERYELFDLLGERIGRLCLNRNRLYEDGYRDRPDRPRAVEYGTVPNPLYRP